MRPVEPALESAHANSTKEAQLVRAPFRRVDVAVVGGGLAGSIAAAVLGRMPCETVLIEPHDRVANDFRCEKLDPGQIEALGRLGLASHLERFATRSCNLWVARRGRLLDKLPVVQLGILYPDMVDAFRSARPDRVAFIPAAVTKITTSEDRQTLYLSNGDVIACRLVVLANGANQRLRQSIGMTHHVVSPQHSLAIGFDVSRKDGGCFDFDSLTYFAERPSDGLAYLTLFKIGERMRANLMAYRLPSDPELTAMAIMPEATITRLMPKLQLITGEIAVSSMTKPRPIDLKETRNLRMPGVVAIGDAFSNSCPAAGTGTSKVFNDVERLCYGHIPDWLASPGMGVEKIAAFYEDPLKQAVDRLSSERAMKLRRTSIDPGMYWRLMRQARYRSRFAKGVARRLIAAMP